MTDRPGKHRALAILTFLATSALGLFAAHCSDDASPGTGSSSGGPDANATDTSTSGDTGTVDDDSGNADTGPTTCPAGYEEYIPAAAGCETKNPIGIDAAKLGLWLRADRGLGCASGRVTVWSDQSGKGRNAMAIAGHRAPACTPYSELDASLPHFPAEGVDAATPVDAGKWDEDTLAVDLSFLANTAYTIIAVDRRHAPSKDYSFFLGTGVPSYDDYGPTNTDRGLHVGYRFEGLFWFDQFNNPTMTSVQGLDAGADASADAAASYTSPLRVTWAMNDGSGDAGPLRVTRSDWAGAMPGDAGAARLMPVAADGRLGRGFGNTNLDTRFRGDLAELIVFTKALSDAELSEVQTYVQRHWGLF